MAPVEVSSVSPGGKDPELRKKVVAPTAPVTLDVAEYGAPTVAVEAPKTM